MPAEEASQEVNHAKIDATINTSGVMKRLGCDSLEKNVSARQDATSACGAGSPHAKKCISARGKRLPACGGAFPHAENACPRAELALRTRRTYVRMRSWPSACGNGRRAGNCTSRLPQRTVNHVIKFVMT